MSQFTNFDPETSVIPCPFATKHLGREHFVVLKGFEYYIGEKEDLVWIYIPKGYITDGATIPKCLSKYIPSWGEYGAAAIVHDYLCENLTVINHGQVTPISRVRGDNIFYEAMKVLKVPFYKRLAFWAAVRLWAIVERREKPVISNKKVKIQQQLTEWYNTHGNYDIKEV